MVRRLLGVTAALLLASAVLVGCGSLLLLPSAPSTPTLVPLPSDTLVAPSQAPSQEPTPTPGPPSSASSSSSQAPTGAPTTSAVAISTPTAGVPAVVAVLPTQTRRSEAQSVVVADQLNVRTGPGTVYDRTGQLERGAEVEILGRNLEGTWWEIAYSPAEGGRGWVSGQYIATDVEPAEMPVVQAPPLPPAPTATTHATTRLTGKIVFQEASGGRIFRINADGTELTYLTNGMDPDWSPEGDRIAFARWAWDPPGIFTMNADGSDQQQVYGGPKSKAPAWSPDGALIAFTSERNESAGEFCFTPPPGYGGSICISLPKVNKWKLRVLTLATGHVIDPASDPFGFSPSWSPDGSQLVYDGVQGLRPADPIGGHDQGGAFIDYDSRDTYPVWSPSGDRIAFMYDQNGHWEIYTVNADGSGRTRLTESPLFEPARDSVAPEWSPDGRWIAFVTNRRGPWEIWVMRADGSEQQPLFPPSTLDGISIHYDSQSEHVIDWHSP